MKKRELVEMLMKNVHLDDSYVVRVQTYPNGQKRVKRIKLGETRSPKEHSENDKEYHIRATRRCRQKNQFESEKWIYKITLTVGDESINTNPKLLLSKAKKLLELCGVKYWLVAQTHKNKTQDGLYKWHIHGVVNAPIDLNLWCELTGAGIDAQKSEYLHPQDTDQWFFYIIKQMEQDRKKSQYRITGTNCKPQKLCKCKTEFLKDSEQLKELCEQYENQTLRGVDLMMFQQDLEEINSNTNVKVDTIETSNFNGKIAKMLTTSRDYLYGTGEKSVNNDFGTSIYPAGEIPCRKIELSEQSRYPYASHVIQSGESGDYIAFHRASNGVPRLQIDTIQHTEDECLRLMVASLLIYAEQIGIFRICYADRIEQHTADVLALCGFSETAAYATNRVFELELEVQKENEANNKIDFNKRIMAHSGFIHRSLENFLRICGI